MGSPAAHPLRSVSDTALLVAYHRAMESRRPDALFRDPIAERLSGRRGEEIARRLSHGRRMAWSTIVRTVLLDEVIGRSVSAGIDAVLNLAAGLDARPYRMALPASLRWIEVDLPDMVREKEQALAGESPACRVERIPVDLADAAARRAVFARVNGASRNVLVLSEGLLVYLSPETVGALADDLHAHPSFGQWAIDLATPMIKKRVNRWWGKRLQQANTLYQFAPEEGTAFFAPHGWREVEFHALFDASVRLKRTMSGIRVFQLMQRIAPKRSARAMQKWRAGVVLLEPT